MTAEQPLDLGLTAVETEREAEEAAAYWAQEERQPRRYHFTPPYVDVLVNLVARAQAATVLEFGCGAGRNLAAIEADHQRRGTPTPELVGIDVNARAIELGRDAYGLLGLQVGGIDALRTHASDGFDVVFTVSVLDHLPDPESAFQELVRISRGLVLLIEPEAAGASGRVIQATHVGSDGGARQGTPAPYSYVHDYDAMVLGASVRQQLRCPLPASGANLGPGYVLRVLERVEIPDWVRRVRGLLGGCRPQRVLASSADASQRIDALLARVGRVPRPGTTLYVASNDATTSLALTEARPDDLVLATERASGALQRKGAGRRWADVPCGGGLSLFGGRPARRSWLSGAEDASSRRAVRAASDAALQHVTMLAIGIQEDLHDRVRSLISGDLDPERGAGRARRAGFLRRQATAVGALLWPQVEAQLLIADAERFRRSREARLRQLAAAPWAARAAAAAGHQAMRRGLPVAARLLYRRALRLAPGWDDAAASLADALEAVDAEEEAGVLRDRAVCTRTTHVAASGTRRMNGT